MSEHPLHHLAMEIRYELTAAQGKLTEMMRMIGELDPVGPPAESFMNGPVTAEVCSSCGIGGDVHTDDCEAVVSHVADLDPPPWPDPTKLGVKARMPEGIKTEWRV